MGDGAMKLDIPQALESATTNRQGLWRTFLVALVLVCLGTRALAATTLTVQIEGVDYTARAPALRNGPNISVGDDVTITLTVANGTVSQPIQLPHADGLVVSGSGTNPSAGSEDLNFFVTPTRAGDVSIPAFDIHTDDGQTLHVNAIKFHVVGQ
jgi:uncharacterized protein (DUF58 family)